MKAIRAICGPFFIVAGIMHFITPRTYKAIMPRYLPAPEALVYASGVAEAAGGLGLMIPSTRKRAGWLLVATLVAIFPANVQMAQHPERYKKVPGGKPALLARLPLQGVLVAWVLSAAKRTRPDG